MTAIEFWHNGRKLATAGGEDVNLLLVILRWRRSEAGSDEADIEICGQRDMVHLTWKDVTLQRGDEVVLRLVDAGEMDVDQSKEIPLRNQDEST